MPLDNTHGTLLVTKAHLVATRPGLLGIVNNDTGPYVAHIVYDGEVHSAAEVLDGAFQDFVHGCPVKLRVQYVNRGHLVRTTEYGWNDSCSIACKVYCGVTSQSVFDALCSDSSLVVVVPDEFAPGFFAYRPVVIGGIARFRANA